jgi:hypothetical protein
MAGIETINTFNWLQFWTIVGSGFIFCCLIGALSSWLGKDIWMFKIYIHTSLVAGVLLWLFL